MGEKNNMGIPTVYLGDKEINLPDSDISIGTIELEPVPGAAHLKDMSITLTITNPLPPAPIKVGFVMIRKPVRWRMLYRAARLQGEQDI